MRRSLAAAVSIALIIGCSRKDPAVTRTFPATNVKRVVFRAAAARSALVRRGADGSVVVHGRPIGGAEGYHSPDPDWKETPADKRGLDFVSKLYGTTLVISTVQEVEFMHHHYSLDGLSITVPKGVEVILERRVYLLGTPPGVHPVEQSAPDLREPHP